MSRRKNKDNYYAPWERLGGEGENGHDNFVRIFQSVLTSKAFLSLSTNARMIYITLKAEWRGQGRSVICPYSFISERSGVRRAKIRRSLEELQEFGFIKIEEGTKQNKVGKPSNVYVFTSEWKNIQCNGDIRRVKDKLKAQWKNEDANRKKAKEKVQETAEKDVEQLENKNVL